MSQPHQKHPKMIRPNGDQYARTDVALVGSTCAVMDPLITAWTTHFDPAYRALAVIGDHGEGVAGTQVQAGEKTFFTPAAGWNEYDERIQRGHYDVAFVNGNHYPAARQIVFVDPKKAATLERRREQLTDVLAVVLCPGAEAVPGWLRDDLAARGQEPVFCTLAEVEAMLLPLLDNLLSTRVPALHALILTGGKSTRMGQRKADLVYRADGLTEAERMANICHELLPGRVHFSVADTATATPGNYPQIADRFLGLGPAGAIASAFLANPNVAWLVLACDLPLLEKPQLETLLAVRNPRQYATAYQLSSQPFPEPLVAIYEPRAYPRLLQFLGLGYSCPRKLLINSEVDKVMVADEGAFRNVNTVEEREEVMGLLG